MTSPTSSHHSPLRTHVCATLTLTVYTCCRNQPHYCLQATGPQRSRAGRGPLESRSLNKAQGYLGITRLHDSCHHVDVTVHRNRDSGSRGGTTLVTRHGDIEEVQATSRRPSPRPSQMRPRLDRPSPAFLCARATPPHRQPRICARRSRRLEGRGLVVISQSSCSRPLPSCSRDNCRHTRKVHVREEHVR